MQLCIEIRVEKYHPLHYRYVGWLYTNWVSPKKPHLSLKPSANLQS
jgi:hypothetical protein